MAVTKRVAWPSLALVCVLSAGAAGWYSAASGQSVPTKVSKPPTTHVHASGDEQRCASCHEALPDGRLRTRFSHGRLKPATSWLGITHDRDWLVRHRWVAADRGALCAKCHKESDCTDCHDSRTRPRAIHPNDWLTLHPQHARRSATDCQGCHSPQTFCTECHARLGISQLAAAGTRAGRRFHPPAALWVGTANQHGREAQRSLSSCVSCHAEQDCIRCHAAGVSGGTRSPHPADFLDRCGSLLSANTRACVSCHGPDLAALRRQCGL